MKDEVSDKDSFDPSVSGEITLVEDRFYMLMHYYPQGEPISAMRPVINLLSFDSPSDALEYIKFYVLPKYAKKDILNEKTDFLSELLLKALETKTAADIEAAVDCYNKISGINNAEMPAIDRIGNPDKIMSSGILLSVIGNKRVRIKHPVLKALLDIKKFDGTNQQHLRMAEKFLKQVLR